MVTEIYVFKIDPEDAREFEKKYTELVPVLRRQIGYQSDKLMRAIERPEEYILIIEWDSVEAHQVFIDSESYPQIDGIFGRFVKQGILAHYNTVASS